MNPPLAFSVLCFVIAAAILIALYFVDAYRRERERADIEKFVRREVAAEMRRPR